MPKSLIQIKQQIAKLEAQAESIRKQELSGVVSRIKEAIKHYDLTAADLGLSVRGGRRANAAGKVVAKKASRKTGATKIKFRDDSGNTWTGRGRRPKWYTDAIASGKTPEQLAV